ncbi:MAG: DUF1476 domain-containing protein [Alphaproteobacteria bacterium]
MGIFDDREKAQENKYFRDEELRFKSVARRNKLFGAWVAGELGKKGPEIDAYVQAVQKADMEEAGDADLIRKVLQDFRAAGKTVAEADLKKRLEASLKTAIEQLEAGK